MPLNTQIMQVLSLDRKKFDPPRGGLLTLAGLALIVTPLRLIYSLVVDFSPLFVEGTLQKLILPTSPNYNPILATLIIVEGLTNVVFLIAFIFLGLAFFQRRRFVPKMFVLVLLANLIFVAADAFVALKLLPEEVIDFSFFRDVVIMLFHCLIFIPYFLFAKRLKEIFIH
jgi:hypothetical protein